MVGKIESVEFMVCHLFDYRQGHTESADFFCDFFCVDPISTADVVCFWAQRGRAVMGIY